VGYAIEALSVFTVHMETIKWFQLPTYEYHNVKTERALIMEITERLNERRKCVHAVAFDEQL
jgi:hypothetical protein